MSLTLRLQPSFSRSIHYLYFGKWCVWLLFALAVATRPSGTLLTLVFLLCLLLFFALSSWEQSARRQFVRAAPLPRFLGTKLRMHYPHLSVSDVDLVLLGLREFFIAPLRSKRAFVAMLSNSVSKSFETRRCAADNAVARQGVPTKYRVIWKWNKVVDSVWHEFILHIRGHEAWCHNAFGRLLHHTSAEALDSD